ncbi:hypothetical protein VV11_001790, partial [Trichodesmium erythraeum 21-75]|nr:hypothetical protein [Trichodesmium erythraeum 21-75]
KADTQKNRKVIKLSLALTIPKTAKEFRTKRSGGQWIIIWAGNYYHTEPSGRFYSAKSVAIKE